jgi:serine/threonine protein kinase
MGTVFYMSPEQVQGKDIDIRSDIYSLGVTFYQMLTGISPYDGMTTEFEVYSKIVSEPLPNASTIYPGVPEFLDKVILKATAKNMANRFQSCDEFSKYLSEKKTPVIEQKTVANPIIASTPPLPEENVVKMPKISTLEIIPIILVTLVVIFLIYSASKGNNAATTEMASIDSVTTNPNISPESVMNTIFQAANTGEVEILKFLLPPFDDQTGEIPCDGDCKALCNPGNESMREELGGNYVTVGDFKEYFSKAYITGVDFITGDRAKVNFVFGSNLERIETMNMQRINGSWYLSSF